MRGEGGACDLTCDGQGDDYQQRGAHSEGGREGGDTFRVVVAMRREGRRVTVLPRAVPDRGLRLAGLWPPLRLRLRLLLLL